MRNELLDLYASQEAQKDGSDLCMRAAPKILQAPVDWSHVVVPAGEVGNLQITVSVKKLSDGPCPTWPIYDATNCVSISGVATHIDDLKLHPDEGVRKWMETIDERLEEAIIGEHDLPPVFLVWPSFCSYGDIADGNHRVLATERVLQRYATPRDLHAILIRVPFGLWATWNMSVILSSYLRAPDATVRLLRSRMSHIRSVRNPLRGLG